MTSAGDDRERVPIDMLREPGLRATAEEIFRAAIEAVEPSRLVIRAFQSLPTAVKDALAVRRGRLLVVGAGKAVGAMAAAIEDALPGPAAAATPPISGGRLERPRRGGESVAAARSLPPPPEIEGLVVAKRGAPAPHLRRIRLVEAGHPVPDEDGMRAAAEMLDLVAGLGPDDLAFALFSGGGSALTPAPPPGISLEDLRATTALLLEAGATIHELNAVRKHLSRFGGGAIARASRAAALVAFVISDVPGDRLDSVASGPTVPDGTTFREAFLALRTHGLVEKVPPAVREYLERGARGRIPETPKAGDEAFARTRTVVIGSNRTALDAAAERASKCGFAPVILQGALNGEARKIGEALGRRMLALREKGPRAIIAGGESTVRVVGDGRGGRSQELALGAALALAGTPGVAVLAGGTDGEDGPTDAAGAVVDGATVLEARAADLDPEQALARNDSYTFFARAGGLVKTGPTGTNVMDVAIGLIA